MVQGIGKVKTFAQRGGGLFDCHAILNVNMGHGQQMQKCGQHVFGRALVVASENPLQLQHNRLADEQRLATFQQLPGHSALFLRRCVGEQTGDVKVGWHRFASVFDQAESTGTSVLNAIQMRHQSLGLVAISNAK